MARFKIGDRVRTYAREFGTIIQKRHKRRGVNTAWLVKYDKPVPVNGRPVESAADGRLPAIPAMAAMGWYATGDIELTTVIEDVASLDNR